MHFVGSPFRSASDACLKSIRQIKFYLFSLRCERAWLTGFLLMSERQYVHMHLIQCFIDLCVVVSKVRESRLVAASDVKGRGTGMK